ncbi:MAG TPA: D-glycerate dehydrogenase [Polyangiaceae bacterium]|jgi:glyoxylate reductase
MSKVFVSGPLPGDAVERLAARHDVVVGREHEGVRGDAFAAIARELDGLVALLTDRVDAALLGRAPRLRVVANVAVGVDNVDLAACAARGVVVTNTPGVLTEATADLAFGLLLAAARRIAEGDRIVRSGAYAGWTPSFLLGARVHGATLGIVGLGRIGQAVARRARGFGMRVLYAQPARLGEPLERALGATHVPIDALFAQADFVSLHCPLTPDTHHLVDAQRLAAMKPGAVLVNTARGPCIDETALAEALARGPLGAAALDVFEDEPHVHPALLALDNVVLAPHVGSADRPTREAMARIAADNVLAVLAGDAPLTPVERR